jgi:outer membrane scaffolding protein for murein synthesis (MipA/OmpV family)
MSIRKRCLLVLLLPLSALAQDPAAEPALLGAGARSRPAYDGSASQYLEAVPVLRYWSPILFIRSTRGPLEGGVHFECLPGLDAGLQLAYEQGRQTSESRLLSEHNMPNVARGGSYGGHLEWNGKLGPAPVNAILRARQNLKAEQGFQGDLRLTAGLFQAWGVSAGLVGEATWADAKSNGAIYGITARQAAISGFPVFAPGGGLLSNSLGVIGSYDLASHWLLVGELEGRRLQGDAARSPLTERRTNAYLVLGAAYRF